MINYIPVIIFIIGAILFVFSKIFESVLILRILSLILMVIAILFVYVLDIIRYIKNKKYLYALISTILYIVGIVSYIFKFTIGVMIGFIGVWFLASSQDKKIVK